MASSRLTGCAVGQKQSEQEHNNSDMTLSGTPKMSLTATLLCAKLLGESCELNTG